MIWTVRQIGVYGDEIGTLVFYEKIDWLAVSIGKKTENPIGIISLFPILEDVKKRGTRYGSVVAYYEAKALFTQKEAVLFKKILF